MLTLRYLATLVLSLSACFGFAHSVELEPLSRRFWSPPPKHGHFENCTSSRTSVTPKPTDPICRHGRHKGCLGEYQNNTNTTHPHVPVPVDFVLQQQEHLVWAYPNDTSNIPILSVVIETKPSERIIDMEKFSAGLAAVVCAEDMRLQFQEDFMFQEAKKEWDWVNQDSERTFILVGDPKPCNPGESSQARQPWNISHAIYDSAALTVRLTATKVTWADTAYKYSMDWGMVQPALQTRDLNGWSKTMAIDLQSTWDRSLFRTSQPFFNIQADCVGCGTKGSLVLGGHIDGIFSGPRTVSVSATPRSVEAAVNLEVKMNGEYEFQPGDKYASSSFEVRRLPIPAGFFGGIHVYGLLDVGPMAIWNVGYDLISIKGTSKISAGASAKIPDDSEATVRLFGPGDAFSRRGWKPVFEVKPLQIDAELNAKAEIWSELAVSLVLSILKKHDEHVDLGFKFPRFIMDAAAGYKSGGFCPNNTKPFGVSLDIDIGAAIHVKASGKKELEENHEFFDENMWKDDELYSYPQICLPFDLGICDIVPQPEDEPYYSIEVVGSEEALQRRSSKAQPPHRLLPRARKPYYLDCDTKKQSPISIKDYPSVSNVKTDDKGDKERVPIILPYILCDDETEDVCSQTKWDVEEIQDITLVDSKTWAMEHVYEGVWIKDYMSSLVANHGFSCSAVSTDIFAIGKDDSFSDKLLRSIGNSGNYKKTMVLLPQRENLLKYHMFANHKLVTNFEKRKDGKKKNTAAHRACALGRIINVCKYMARDVTQARLKATILSIETALDELDKNADLRKHEPDGFKGYSNTHMKWFLDYYKNGIENARNRLMEMAKFLQNSGEEFDNLGSNLKEAVNDIAKGNVDKWCRNTFGEYPGKGLESPRPAIQPPVQQPSNHIPPPTGSNVGVSVLGPWRLTVHASQISSDSPNNIFLPVEGTNRKTVNTRCVAVSESNLADSIPGHSDLSTVPKDTPYTFENDINGSKGEGADASCCLAYFSNSDCSLTPGQYKKICPPPGEKIVQIGFKSWQVFGCLGKWVPSSALVR